MIFQLIYRFKMERDKVNMEATVTLSVFHKQYQQEVDDYIIEDIQFTGHPREAVELAEKEPDRHAILILHGQALVGFFVLHGWAGAKKYTDDQHALLLRTFSIDTRHQGKGYAKQAMKQLPDFVRTNFSDIERVVLGVNRANYPAQNLYLRNGFSDTGRRVIGAHGEQYVFEQLIHC
ncbi:GCN5 family acetyltransferase [Sporolactobacillus laevolacticus DSM 442]|uniref:GCN5 family acetyltransferase n=2 Tax=Sporolactobacillus laevolacticus TaxID=33018 RepID=V6IUP0_9BACL|nr:GCN5 family acetyltransferase [Sporolactobacillus laevolacticus DSM 442]